MDTPDNLTYTPEREEEVQQLDNPLDPVYSPNNQEKTVATAIFELQHFLNDAISEVCDISDRPISHLDKLESRLHGFVEEFVQECIVEKNERLERPKRIAKRLVFDTSYPTDIRLEMFKLVSEQKYNEVHEVALSYDKEHRERPHIDKEGPDEPLSVNTDQHIDWNDAIEKIHKNPEVF